MLRGARRGGDRAREPAVLRGVGGIRAEAPDDGGVPSGAAEAAGVADAGEWRDDCCD